ncbi:MAG: response regulator transcription factor [Nitrospiraceae bacterium]|nr:response regulator transcription factor [Nitrospiraceae bacterium]
MGRIDRKLLSGIRESLAKLADSLETAPIVFIDDKGDHWMNLTAEKFISGKGLSKNDFMQWIKIGSSHLHNFIYGDTDISLMKFPGGGALAFLRHNEGKADSEPCNLTKREVEVLRHLAKGHSNRQIAEMMGITPGTVNTHLDNIYQKLGCSNRSMACLLALRNGLLRPLHRTLQCKKT